MAYLSEKPSLRTAEKSNPKKSLPHSPEEVFKFLFQNYPLGGGNDIAHLQKEMHELQQIGTWEELASGLVEVM